MRALRPFALTGSLVVALLSLTPTITLGQTTEAEQELEAIHRQWATARIDGDVAYLERLYAPEFRITAMNGMVVERADDIAVFAIRPRVLIPTYIVDDNMRMSFYGDVGLVTGIEHLKGTLRGQYGEMALRFTNIFVRRQGRWQLVAHHSTKVPD